MMPLVDHMGGGSERGRRPAGGGHGGPQSVNSVHPYGNFAVLSTVSVLRDQWIRAKYERREFTGENVSQTYFSG